MDIKNWNEALLPYEQAVDELVVKFRNLDMSYRRLNLSSPMEIIEGRVKRISSILDKAKRKQIQTMFIEESIEDIAGIRIICRFVEDIDRVIEIIRSRHGVDLEVLHEQDYVKNPKPSGYRSYHVVVKYPVMVATGYREVRCEIQIRTMAMNFWATIEHSLRYKYRGNIPDDLTKRLISCAHAAASLDSEMSEIRDEILSSSSDLETKTRTIDEILEKVQMLYFASQFDAANELNRKFFNLYEADDDEGMAKLGESLKIMSDVLSLDPESRLG